MPNEKTVKFRIDGKECTAKEGQNLVEAAADNGVYIPTLCYVPGKKCLGTCRACIGKIGGREAATCTYPVAEGMEVEINTPELEEKRQAVVEMMFVERNHYCPSCEKSGRCDLQAVAYRMGMTAPQFPYRYSCYGVDATPEKFILEHNRCILCERCIEFVRDKKTGAKIFSMANRGSHAVVSIDYELADKMDDAQVEEAAHLCPVGAILKKGVGFDVPIGKRKYDQHVIGEEVERKK